VPNLTSLTGASNSQTSHSLPTGAIVGAIIIAIAVVSCLIFATRTWKQRKRIKDSLGVNPFPSTGTTNAGSFPLYTRVVSSDSDLANGARLNTTSNSTPQTGFAFANRERDAGDDVPPSYDESNRMTVVR